MNRLVRAAIVAFAAALIAAGCARQPAQQTRQPVGGPAGEALKIGLVAPITGSIATFGISTKQGAEMVFDDVNRRGGLLGRRVELLVEDDAGKPEEAANVFTKLVNRDRVVAIIGSVATKCSLAGAPVCQRAGVPMITPASTNPKVTEVGDYIFRVCFIDPFQGEVIARFLVGKLGLKRVGIIYDLTNDYSKGLADYVEANAKKLGAQIVSRQTFSEQDKSFKAQLTAMATQQPQAIFVSAYYTEAALIARQARQLGITATLMGPDGFDSPMLIKSGGSAVEGAYFSNHYSADSTAPETQAFVQAYRKRYGEAPDALAALGYDAAALLVDAIKRAGSVEGRAIRGALAATTDYHGATGAISMDAQRNARKPAVILEVKRGKFVLVETIQPR
jgi:branched-chain amino acid transport system substrate-binding protein